MISRLNNKSYFSSNIIGTNNFRRKGVIKMKIYSVDLSNGETKKLVVYDESKIVEKAWISTAIIKTKKDFVEEYLQEKEKFETLEDFLYEKEYAFSTYIEEYVEKEDLKCEENEVLWNEHQQDIDDADFFEYDLVLDHWDESNWAEIPLLYDATEDYPGLERIHTEKYETGEYDIYKDETDSYYIVDSSRFQGTLDFLEPIGSKKDLKENFEIEI